MLKSSAIKSNPPISAPDTHSEEGHLGSTDLLLLLMTVIWGSNFTAIKYSLEDLLPLSFNGLRILIGSVALLALARVLGKSLKVPRGDGWRLFGLGVLSNAVYQTVFIIGMARTRAGNAALILATTPLFTAVIGRLCGQEFFTRRGVAGLLLAFLGIVLIVLSGNKDVGFGETLVGDCLVVAATICWAAYTVGARRLVGIYGSLKATTLMMVTGTIPFLLLCAPSLVAQDWSRVRPVAWAGLAYSGFLAIALAQFIWNYGVRKIGSTRTAIYSNITPVVAVFVAWLALGESPTWGQVSGAAVIFPGLYLARRGMIAARSPLKESKETSLDPGKN